MRLEIKYSKPDSDNLKANGQQTSLSETARPSMSDEIYDPVYEAKRRIGYGLSPDATLDEYYEAMDKFHIASIKKEYGIP